MLFRSLTLVGSALLFTACSSPDDMISGAEALETEALTSSQPSQNEATTPLISIDFSSDAANRLLSACAFGDAVACDASQRNAEISNDGVFSRFHANCQGGDQDYCALLDGLVAAELRMRGVTPDTAGTGANGQMITPGGESYLCGDETFTMGFEAGAVFITDADGNAARLDLLDDRTADVMTFTNGRMTVFRSNDAVRFARGRRAAVTCDKS